MEVVTALKNHGIIVVGGFIFGHPEDTKATLMENYEYAKKMRIDIPLFNILTPHLKTELRKELIREGLVTNPSDYSRYNHYHCNVKTRHLTSEQLYQIRNNLDARYPLDSGSFFRLLRAYPVFFSTLMLRMIREEPRNWLNFATGIFRN
jgi:radical SAM superfamily enzyme YgiQ (UPF0313 family)